MERLIELLDRYHSDGVFEENMELYIASVGEKADLLATKLVDELRDNDFFVEKDICQRSLKAQFKYADKMKAEYVIAIGDDDVASGKAKMKIMDSGKEVDVKLNSCSLTEDIFAQLDEGEIL